jgi:hypothetical protein
MAGVTTTVNAHRLIFALLAAMLGLQNAAPVGATVGVHPFHRTWQRTDQPVSDLAVDRTWMWGPLEDGYFTIEPYRESPGGERDVVYFDKSRMEISRPEAIDDGVWYVTNGLLVVELVSGRMQTGDAQFVDRRPADVNIAGDPGQRPAYADIDRWGLRDGPARAAGAIISERIDDGGEVYPDATLVQHNVTAAERVTVSGIDHTVASPFWQFMNSRDSVYSDGQLVTDELFASSFYATGLPITEAWWSRIAVGGRTRDVLWQCFERRCLTYTPDNPTGWQVEAGNVGLHYYQWRYDSPRPEPERMTVTFRLFHDGAQFATTVTHEVFFGDVAVGSWTTTDMNGAAVSRGTLDADHSLTGIDALITQQWPFSGTGDLTFDYGIGLGGLSGSGTLSYTAHTASGVVTGTVAFDAQADSPDVWDVTLEEVPPILFGGE